MKKQKEHYIHICGKAGVGFAPWLFERLKERNIKPVLVDCGSKEGLKACASCRMTLDIPVTDAGAWWMGHEKAEAVIFFHEQEDVYMDLAQGLYLFFVNRQSLAWVNGLLKKLTGDRLCLFEPILLPQLQNGRRLYILALYKQQVEGEYYIPAALLDEGASPYEEELLELFCRTILPYLEHSC